LAHRGKNAADFLRIREVNKREDAREKGCSSIDGGIFYEKAGAASQKERVKK